MMNMVLAANRPRVKASRAFGVPKAFPRRGKALPQAGITPAEEVKRNGVPMKVCFHGADWRMPSDAVSALWLEELEGLN